MKSTKNSEFKFDYSWLTEDTIYYRYKDNSVIDKEDIKKMLDLQSTLGIDATKNRIIHVGQYCTITASAREYVEKHKPKAKSEAYILPGLSHRILFNAYSKIRSKENPIKSFKKLSTAIEWIENIEKRNQKLKKI